MNIIKLNPIQGLSFLAEENGKPCHKHMLCGVEIPGCTSVSGLFQEDGWKFAWPVKLMFENLAAIATTRNVTLVDIIKAKGLWRATRDSAADTGTQAHGYIEDWIKGGKKIPPNVHAHIKNPFNEFIKWEHTVMPEWLGSEIQVGSAKHKFAGILDALARIGGLVTLVDFKTSSDIKDDYAIQLAGLCIALEEMGLVVAQRAILHLPKEGQYEFRLITSNLAKDKEAFLAALNFYNHRNLFMGRLKSDKRRAKGTVAVRA